MNAFLHRYIDSRAGFLRETRRFLHTNPEPSGEEFATSRRIFEVLREAGVEPQMPSCERGVICDIGAANAAKRVALRADIDALHIQDMKEVPYASQCSHVMHACGHDGHTSCALGATLALHAAFMAGELPADFAARAVFQPAEETGQGAREMTEAGALEGVDAILALHLDPSRAAGRVGMRYGALTAACDDVEFVITGSGGHAARPHESRDPVFAASQLINALYGFIPRATDSNDSVVLTIGQVVAGDNPNVIPESALLRGTLRTLHSTTRDATQLHIEKLAAGIAEVSDTSIAVQFEYGPGSVVNDASLVDLLREAASAVVGSGSIDIIERPSMGGEDFSFYLQHVPGAMFRLGCASDDSNSYPLHSPYFDIDERALAIGAKILAEAAVMWSPVNT